MKIPMYQPQVGYQRPQARAVQLATPTMETSLDDKWAKLMQVSGKINSMVQIYQGVSSWLPQKGQANMQNESEHSQFVVLGENNSFSAPQRQALLQFGRNRAFDVSGAENKSVSAARQPSAVEKLDSYFEQQIQPSVKNVSADNPDQNLLFQDYVVLRQEIAQVEKKQQQQAHEDAFLQAAHHVIETAGLIRTPSALAQYMQSNLSAAGQEALQMGYSAASWKNYQQQVYSSAVSHNVQSALSSGELPQAEQIYQYFQDKLNPNEKDLLEAKITAYKANQLASTCWPQAYQACVSKDKQINEDKLHQFALQAAEPTGVNARELMSALHTKVHQQLRQEYKQDAQNYRQLWQAAAKEPSNITAYLQMKVSNAAQFTQTKNFWQQLHTQPKQFSAPEVFNDLYTGAEKGKISGQDIQEAYQRGELSLKDVFLLLARLCETKSEEQNPEEPMILMGVKALCRKQQFTPAQTAQAQYFVLSAGTDIEKRLKAAQKLKQLLTLQENSK